MRGSYSGYIKQYNVDTPASYIYLMAASLAFWVIGFIYSLGYPVYGGVISTPLWETVCRILPDKTVTYLIGFILMIGGAFLIHRANYILVIIREKTFLPFLLYALFISTNPDFFPLKSTSVGIFCLILAMYQLFTSYHDTKAVDKAFNAALFIGIGSLLWIHILWFFPLFWLGMYHFKALSLRTFLASLMGICTVYWFILGWCLFEWDFTPFTLSFIALTKIRFLHIMGTGLFDWVIISYLGFLALLSLVYILTHDYDDNLRARQYLFFLIMFTLLSFGLFFFYEQSSDEFLCVSCMPLSILLTHFFTVNKGKKRCRGFHLAFIVYIALSFARLWSFLSNTVI